MSDLLSELQEHVLTITFNRIQQQNAFDERFLADFQILLDEAQTNPQVRVLVIKANGRHFSAGADLNWMKRMANFSEADNRADARVLARVIYTLNQFPKPTIAMVHGAAFGGGAGIVAACDIAIAAQSARFCFSEVKLGLIPAVISPYVIKAIGQRAAMWLFISAEIFDANRAYELQLVQHVMNDEELIPYALNLAKQIADLPPIALREAKALVRRVAEQPIDETLLETTAELIAQIRVSEEAQQRLTAFLKRNK